MITDFPTLDALIVISYSMTARQDFAYQVARAGLEMAGFAQPNLSAQALGMDTETTQNLHNPHPQNPPVQNTCGALTLANLRPLFTELRGIDHPVVLHTTAHPTRVMIALVNEGAAIVQATYYDPHKTDLPVATMRRQIATLTEWLYRPNCLPIYDADLVEHRPLAITDEIMQHLELTIPRAKVLNKVLNSGRENQHDWRVDTRTDGAVSHAFPRFYQKMIRGRAELYAAGVPPLRKDEVLL